MDHHLALLENMAVPCETPSAYPATLREIEHLKTGKLCCPSDATYEFLVELEKQRLKLHTYSRLMLIGSDMPGIVTKELLESKTLQASFSSLVQSMTANPEAIECSDEDTPHDMIASILWFTIDRACTASEVREQVILLYMKSGNKKFRTEVMASKKIQKKEAHRKRVMKRAAKSGKRQAKAHKSTESVVVPPAPETSETEDDKCAWCGSAYKEGDPWVCCDGCAAWYERECTDLVADEARWERISDDGFIISISALQVILL